MTLKIISNEERVKTVTGVKMVIFGPYGIGKTSLLKTLDESTTLCLDFEAGLLAVQDWKGDSISVRTWNEARDIACLIGGPNPARLCCIATYERLTIARIISNLLKILFFCNQSDQI
ncbi:AAA family ATPase [Wolbachia endosymbiont (group A) of Urophora cardui]|uniref:AAA family ATPase n=1 Tax=Wolbachia endosymbiont (group A) of Urophora cardui TaxID=3066156 RepID=UPI00397A150D